MMDEPFAPGVGIVPARTWMSEEEVPPIIENFLQKEYSREHYEAIAKAVEEKLKSLLEAGGVTKCKLSRRAKDRKSLKEKLIVRNRDKKDGYKDSQEIKKDIVDLAGVRIILYMPTKEDHTKVKEVIQKEWGQGIVAKVHPPPQGAPNVQSLLRTEPEEDIEATKDPEYRRLHLGYRAVHYRVPMRKEDEIEYYGWLEDDQVEIQVVSALTHAWAEVGHDILYKSLAEGRPSLEEERILDALNGLIQSGDLLLEQFQKMYIRRTSQPFKYHEDLMHFLRNFLNPDNVDSDFEVAHFPRGEGIYILFKFLQQEKLNTPRQVLPELEALGYPFHHAPKEYKIRHSFRPVPKIALNMSLVVCLTRHLLHEKLYQESSGPKSVFQMCSIMMSALTMLDFCLGGPEEAREYLQKLNISDQEIASINFLLEDPARYIILLGDLDPNKYNDSVQPAWEWFCISADNPFSLCGFLFRLAQMDCKKIVNPGKKLFQLRIQPLSRSNTSNLDCDTGSGAGFTPAQRTITSCESIIDEGLISNPYTSHARAIT